MKLNRIYIIFESQPSLFMREGAGVPAEAGCDWTAWSSLVPQPRLD